MAKCFVMQPFDGGTFDKRYADVFGPAIEDAALRPYRVDRDPHVDIPIETIEQEIAASDVCFAEITTDNPNVWFELGCAVALKKPVCLACSNERSTQFPFDVRHRKIIRYQVRSRSDFDTLRKELKSLVLRKQEFDSIASLRPAVTTEGLSPHEITAMAYLATTVGHDRGFTMFELKRNMEQAGFNDVATGLAVHALARREYAEFGSFEDDQGELAVIRPRSKGMDWLLQHQDSLNLKHENAEDDIPF